MRVLASTHDITHEEWRELRKKGIGGSDVSAIMGLNPYSSPFNVWIEKIGMHEEIVDNEPAYWGTVLEDVLAKEFTIRTDKRLQRRNAILQHDEHDFMIANVDRVVIGEDAGWEGKTTNAFYKDEGCPQHYWVQCQHYMLVTGKPLWYLSILAGGQKYYGYNIPRDNNYIDNVLMPAEIEFWRMVQENEMPPVDGSDACTEIIGHLYPDSAEDDIELPLDSFALVEQYEELTAKEKELEAEKKRLSNEIKMLMKEHSRGHIFEKKIHWPTIVSQRFDTKSFQRDYPELHDQYLKESKYRRFQIK